MLFRSVMEKENPLVVNKKSHCLVCRGPATGNELGVCYHRHHTVQIAPVTDKLVKESFAMLKDFCITLFYCQSTLVTIRINGCIMFKWV